MLTAAAKAIASTVEADELAFDFIIPSAFNEKVADRVAQAVLDTVNDASLPKTPIYFEF